MYKKSKLFGNVSVYDADEEIEYSKWFGKDQYEYSIDKEEVQHRKWSYRKSKIHIMPKAYKKMFFYTQMAKGEVSGLGKVKKVNNIFKVVDIMLFKQECTTAHTTLSGEMLSKFIFELIKAGKRPEEWNHWWHTHNDFGASFSSEDEGTIKTLSKNSLVIATCMNKMGEIVGRVDEKGQTEEIPVLYYPVYDKKIKDRCYSEVKRKVKEEKEITWKGDKDELKLVEANGYIIHL
jgi:hypothetical protein